MDFLNAIILLLNFTVLPALTYGSQLALGAIFSGYLFKDLLIGSESETFWHNSIFFLEKIVISIIFN